MNPETIDTIIAMKTRQIALLKELQASQAEEAANYIIEKLVPMDRTENLAIIEKSSGRIIFTGQRSRIIRFLHVRGIESVYWTERTDQKI